MLISPCSFAGRYFLFKEYIIQLSSLKRYFNIYNFANAHFDDFPFKTLAFNKNEPIFDGILYQISELCSFLKNIFNNIFSHFQTFQQFWTFRNSFLTTLNTLFLTKRNCIFFDFCHKNSRYSTKKQASLFHKRNLLFVI